MRICVDLTKLNEVVCKEKYILRSVEKTVGLLGRVKVFIKLNTNMWFWQIPLSDHSVKYMTFITLFGRFFSKKKWLKATL